MYVRVIPNNKGKKNTFFCDLVESYRNENGVPRQHTVVKLGQFDAKYVPYLNATFAKGSYNSLKTTDNECERFSTGTATPRYAPYTGYSFFTIFAG